jgi:hypothetical protein
VKTLKRMIGMRAAKATVKHSAHGVVAKAQRRPLRSASLVTVGVALGLGAGLAAGRALGSAA